MEQFVKTSPQALADLIDDLEKEGTQLHCMEVFQGAVRSSAGRWPPTAAMTSGNCTL